MAEETKNVSIRSDWHYNYNHNAGVISFEVAGVSVTLRYPLAGTSPDMVDNINETLLRLQRERPELLGVDWKELLKNPVTDDEKKIVDGIGAIFCFELFRLIRKKELVENLEEKIRYLKGE